MPLVFESPGYQGYVAKLARLTSSVGQIDMAGRGQGVAEEVRSVMTNNALARHNLPFAAISYVRDAMLALLPSGKLADDEG